MRSKKETRQKLDNAPGGFFQVNLNQVLETKELRERQVSLLLGLQFKEERSVSYTHKQRHKHKQTKAQRTSVSNGRDLRSSWKPPFQQSTPN